MSDSDIYNPPTPGNLTDDFFGEKKTVSIVRITLDKILVREHTDGNLFSEGEAHDLVKTCKIVTRMKLARDKRLAKNGRFQPRACSTSRSSGVASGVASGMASGVASKQPVSVLDLAVDPEKAKAVKESDEVPMDKPGDDRVPEEEEVIVSNDSEDEFSCESEDKSNDDPSETSSSLKRKAEDNLVDEEPPLKKCRAFVFDNEETVSVNSLNKDHLIAVVKTIKEKAADVGVDLMELMEE